MTAAGEGSRAVATKDWWIHLLWLAPLLHPLFIPLLGPPSHLLWWSHVLPVARMGFDDGRRGTAVGLGLSLVLVVGGERLFGYGYGSPASWETTLSLALALLFTNLLVSSFALHARRITLQYRVLLAGLPVGAVRTRLAAGRAWPTQ